ncbi:hypothetical protein Tco_0488395 [Tanacetum coccineum]
MLTSLNFVALHSLSSLINVFCRLRWQNKMLPAQPPTRTDEQIVPRLSVVNNREKQLLFNAQKIQRPHLSDISDNSELYQLLSAFTVSQMFLLFYQQHFWKTMLLAITPVNPAHPFELPPSGDTKTSGSDKPRHPVLQMLWGIVTQTNVDHAELIWEDSSPGDDMSSKSQVCPERKPLKEVQHEPANKRAYTQKAQQPQTVKQSKPALSTKKRNHPSVCFHRKLERGKATFLLLTTKMKLKRSNSTRRSLLASNQAPVGGVRSGILSVRNNSKLHEVVGKGKALRDQTPPDSITRPSSQPDDDTSDKEIHESSSTSDLERTESETETYLILKIDKDQVEVDTKLDAALSRFLNDNTADFNQKCSVFAGPGVFKNQDSGKEYKGDYHRQKEGLSWHSKPGLDHKERRSDSAASGSDQPPPKDDDQSSKKPKESGASATKQHPALSSTGWQITNTREAGCDTERKIAYYTTLKSRRYLDCALEELVPSLWVEVNAKYDIQCGSMASLIGGLREGIYINKHMRNSDQSSTICPRTDKIRPSPGRQHVDIRNLPTITSREIIDRPYARAVSTKTEIIKDSDEAE